MADITKIPLAELFADLQVSYTEVIICEILESKGSVLEDPERKTANLSIINQIKSELTRRCSVVELNDFLVNGFPKTIYYAYLGGEKMDLSINIKPEDVVRHSSWQRMLLDASPEMRDIQLIRASIDKWVHIAKDYGVDLKGDNCPLCLHYEGCYYGCPIFEYVHTGECKGTPYQHWAKHQYREHHGLSLRVNCPECKQLAWREVGFLQKLLESVILYEKGGEHADQANTPRMCMSIIDALDYHRSI